MPTELEIIETTFEVTVRLLGSDSDPCPYEIDIERAITQMLARQGNTVESVTVERQ